MLHHNNGTPLNRRKMVRMLVLLTLLAWATQTLLAQWARAADVEPEPAGPASPAAGVHGSAVDAGSTSEEARSTTADAEATTADAEAAAADAEAAAADAGFTTKDARTTTADAGVTPADVEPTPADGTTRATPTAGSAGPTSTERFTPAATPLTRGVTLMLRSGVDVSGRDVTLRQIARWSDGDAEVLDPIAGLVVLHLDPSTKSDFSLEQLRALLASAGLNLQQINFAGAMACAIRRDATPDAADANADANATPRADAATDPAAVPPADQFAPAAGVAQTAPIPTAAPQQSGAKRAALSPENAAGAQILRETKAIGPASLRELLTNDLATRFALERDSLQLDFNPDDAPLLAMAGLQYAFVIEPSPRKDLGAVAWNVSLLVAGRRERVFIRATARAWQEQTRLVRPVTGRQVFTRDDLVTQRVLSDHLASDKLLTPEQIVGQQAARELKTGTLLTAKLIEAVPLARSGQFISIKLQRSGIEITTVARALEGGSFGQSIRVKNETTKDIFRVTLTGPQTASVDAVTGE